MIILNQFNDTSTQKNFSFTTKIKRPMILKGIEKQKNPYNGYKNIKCSINIL